MGRALELVIIFLIVLGVNQSDCLKCYSCGEPNALQQSSSVIPCREFDEASSNHDDTNPAALERFIIECPSSDHVSCTTQKQGNQVSRNCDTLQIDDCQIANGVTYCYCTRNLCNGRMSEAASAITPVPSSKPHSESSAGGITDLEHTIDLSDDEDYSDMSGNGAVDEDHIMKEASEEIAMEAPFNGINNKTIESGTNTTVRTPTNKQLHSGCHGPMGGFNLVLVLYYGLIAAALL